MSKQEVAALPSAAIVEQVLIKGDLSGLNPQQRAEYYGKVCESVGLNPLTKPFEYITLNGKLVLYALRACTDQLRTIHEVSVMELTETEREGVFIVTAKVQNGKGRTDASKGAVSIAGLKGEALANALMKAETKAKRRATLSICGLGFLDETEVETIPGAVVGEPKPVTLTMTSTAASQEPAKPAETVEEGAAEHGISGAGLDAPPTKEETAFARTVFESVKSMVAAATDEGDIDTCLKANKDGLKLLEAKFHNNYQKLKGIVTDRREALKGNIQA